MEHVTATELKKDWRLQIMYGIHNQTDLEEQELAHFEGCRGSSPVRIGNKAFE